MATVTYLVRMIPFTLMRRKIKSVFIKSFLYYIPYGVLSAMTFPYIFYSTENIITSVLCSLAAFVMAYFKRPLIEVAIVSCVVSFIIGTVF
jgi:branched-subunit amino acid transport protein